MKKRLFLPPSFKQLLDWAIGNSYSVKLGVENSMACLILSLGSGSSFPVAPKPFNMLLATF